jgi:hypothetical protein
LKSEVNTPWLATGCFICPSNVWRYTVTTLTVRIPDDKHERLKALAQSRSISVNKLMDELATVALANHDVLMRFQALAAQGNPSRALELLDRLDR